jgi:ABC-2 type transport system ATP-binding protein
VGRAAIFELIRGLGREGKTVIVSSHVLYEIENVTRAIVLINRGRVLAHGDIHEVRALIDAHPHSVTVRCGQPRKLASALIGSPHVVNVEFEEDGAGVTIHTRNANTFYDQVNAMLAEPEFSVESMHSPDDNLQAVFEYLVR